MLYCNEWARMTTHIMSYCKGLNNDTKLQEARSFEGMITTQQSNTVCCWAQKASTISISLMWYCKRSKDNYIFDVARSCCIAREQARWWHHCKMGVRNNHISYMLLVTRTTATSTDDCKNDGNVPTFLCCIKRSGNNDRWLIAPKEHEIVPSNNQLNHIVALRKQATTTGQQHPWCNDMPYVVLQEATSTVTKIDHDKHARLRKGQPTFFMGVDQPPLQSQKRKAPAIIIDCYAMTHRWWCKNHSLLSYCKERQH